MPRQGGQDHGRPPERHQAGQAGEGQRPDLHAEVKAGQMGQSAAIAEVDRRLRAKEKAEPDPDTAPTRGSPKPAKTWSRVKATPRHPPAATPARGRDDAPTPFVSDKITRLLSWLDAGARLLAELGDGAAASAQATAAGKPLDPAKVRRCIELLGGIPAVP